MPGKIKVKVLAGRNLPVMDRAGDTTDAFVEIKFGGVTHKTDVCRKSLNPHWNSTEWYRFEVDESELQDEPLQLRLMDHDTYSANDAIGKVVISLAPLLAREANNAKGIDAHGGAVLSGWIPVFDTMHGIRGELNVIVKVELFSDFNKYKTSSVGVQFFHCPMIPPGYRATSIHGFVEELVVNDDPEYQWIDKIRTPRASNEARQVAFIKLSNQVQRLVGLKAAELGANAVIGYRQDFDLEGEAGVVSRAIGTAVSITPLPTSSQITNVPCTQQQLKKYLDILASDTENVTDLKVYYQSHQEELQKLINILNPKTPSLLDETDNIDDDDTSDLDFTRPVPSAGVNTYTENMSIYYDDASRKSLKHLSEDQTDLNRLLNRIDSDNEITSPLKKIKKLKNNIFSKRIGSFKSRKSGKQDDQISLKSNTSEISRISLTDIKKEFKKLKNFKKIKAPSLEKNEEEGIGMASILARSVLHVDATLASIDEIQDSEPSPASLRRTSESEPTLNMSDEEKSRKVTPDIGNSQNKGNLPEINCTSSHNINDSSYLRVRKISESCPATPSVERSDNLLKLPGEEGYFGSASSALSGDSSTEIYSSSDEDDESYDSKADIESAEETTTSVVQSVLDQKVDPQLIALMDRKLSILECVTPDYHDVKKESDITDTESKSCNTVPDLKQKISGPLQTIDKLTTQEKQNLDEVSAQQLELQCTSAKKKEKFVAATFNNFKFHNPFSHKKASKSISAPSSPAEKQSFVYRSSTKIKRQLSKFSKNRLVKSISHYTLSPKKKNSDVRAPFSQPNSSSDITSKVPSRETVLGAPFLSYTDLLSLDKEKIDVIKPFHKSDDITTKKVSMYIGSEPVSRTSFSGPSSPKPNGGETNFHKLESSHKKEKSSLKPTGLVHVAMKTILMDKVQSLLVPTSPDSNTAKEKTFFDNVTEKLEKVEEAQKLTDVKQGNPPKRERKLTRQDSIQSSTENCASRKMSKELEANIIIPCKVSQTPMLQHFHPILSGAPKLETIPSLSENNPDLCQSLDVDEVEAGETNIASVCDNSHAACDVGRSERDKGERDKNEKDKNEKEKESPRHARHESYGGKEPGATTVTNASVNASSTPLGMHRRSSDSDLSITPKASSLNASGGNTVSGGGAILRPSMNSNNLDLLEYPFLTMTEYPPGFIVHLGGTVCSRSVKLVDGAGAGGGGEAASRAACWAELRTELRAHARALRCNAVLAYTETAAICEDVCVLSASGTAAVINLDCDFNAEIDAQISVVNGSKNTIEEVEHEWCSVAHVPYSPGTGPYRAELSTCGGCRRARVPAVLLATCAKPNRLAAHAKAVTVTAVAARIRRAPPTSEPGARDISDQLPFLEYELHKLLVAKLRMQGANALFSLKTQIAIGERCVMALASGTAYRLTGLPPPTPPRIKSSENDKDALEIQKALWETFAANKAANGYDVGSLDHNINTVLPEVEGEVEAPVLDLCADKDACVLELDEAEDVETARGLATRHPNMVVLGAGLNPLPCAPPQAFTQVFRAKLTLSSGCSSLAERHVSRSLAGISYKLRRLQPCALVTPHFQLDLPEDEIQLVLSGTAIRLMDPKSEDNIENGNHTNGNADTDDEIFALDEEQLVKSPEQEEKNMINGQVGIFVSLTSHCSVSGSRAVRRVCALRLLFVRETTSVREVGGLSGFLHTFTCEVLAIVRAYTAALGGNALTSYYITQLMLQDNAHKNQGQCLLSVGGDVVHVTY